MIITNNLNGENKKAMQKLNKLYRKGVEEAVELHDFIAFYKKDWNPRIYQRIKYLYNYLKLTNQK